MDPLYGDRGSVQIYIPAKSKMDDCKCRNYGGSYDRTIHILLQKFALSCDSALSEVFFVVTESNLFIHKIIYK